MEEIPHKAGPSMWSGETSDESPPPLNRIIEALLFVGGPPLSPERACEQIRGLSLEQFLGEIDYLNQTYRNQNRPYLIQKREQGYEMVLKPRFRSLHESLYGTVRETRLTSAALDVLGLVAYRQPITRQEIDSLRGTDCSAILRQLVRVGLIAIKRGGEKSELGYSTTSRFLQLFQIANLDDLPRTQDPQRL